MRQGSITRTCALAVLCIFTGLSPTKTHAQTASEQVLPASTQSEWMAVGRVNVGLSVSPTGCSGTLISDTQVLTAGHCVGLNLLAEQGYSFLAGYHRTLPITRLPVMRLAYHPNREPELTIGSIPNDLALLTLGTPTDIPPMPIGPPPNIGETLTIISYRNSELTAPTRADGCTVTHQSGRLQALNCAVQHGMSGAPLVRVTENGPELAGVVIATGGGDISFAAAPDEWVAGINP